jgi:Ser/Thr protein kinase RdoA (MazF antagonist)
MPLAEIVAVDRTLDGRGRSEVADAVAAAWGLAGGAARFWRSSASHVFAVREPVAAYLRFVPATWRDRESVAAVAELMARLGSGVAPPLVSTGGRLVETVDTSVGPMHAMMVAAAPGTPIDLADLTPARAREWGGALARLHRPGADGMGLPETLADLRAADAELAGAVARLRAALAELPRGGRQFGVTHGDFELDNLAWDGDRPTAYDFDDAGHSWFVADVGQALRDLVPSGVAPARVPLAAEFLGGYRAVRELSDVDLARLPLFAAAHAAAWLQRLPAVLAEPSTGPEPPWLGPLRDKLAAHAVRQRELVLAWR